MLFQTENTTPTTEVIIRTQEEYDALFERGDLAKEELDAALQFALEKQGDAPLSPDNIAEVVDTVANPIDSLNEAAAEMAGSAFGELAEIGNGLGDPADVVIGGLTLTLHMVAGFVAFAMIATALLFLMFSSRTNVGSRLSHLGASSAKFLVIASLGTTLGIALVEASGRLTNSGITATLPEDIATDANVFESGLAVTVVPIVGVVFDFQQFFVGVLIAFWPLAAALSIAKKFENCLIVVSSLFVANIAWPPLAALAIGQAFASLPSVGTATWWCLGAVATAPICNAIALASSK